MKMSLGKLLEGDGVPPASRCRNRAGIERSRVLQQQLDLIGLHEGKTGEGRINQAIPMAAISDQIRRTRPEVLAQSANPADSGGRFTS